MSDDFEQFWKEYPRKIKKGDARKAWEQTKSIRPDNAAILAALKAAKNCEQWRKDNGMFIPYPATWLRAECWEDVHTVEIEEPIVAQPKVTNAWWVSDDATIEYGNKLGIYARPGESINDYRARLKRAA